MTLRIYFHNNMYNIISKLVHSFVVNMFLYQIRFKQNNGSPKFWFQDVFFPMLYTD